MKTLITALIALIIGGAIGYAYKQVEVSNLTEQVAALETRITETTEEATAAAAAQMEELKAELDAKTTLANEQQAEISELEAALKDATSPPSSAEPTPPEPRSSPTPPAAQPGPQ